MPKIPKGGYPPPTKHKYLTISNPWWGPKEEGVFLGAWLKYMFSKPNLKIEGYYPIPNTIALVVQIEPNVDITPHLGAHKWAKFIRKDCLKPNEVEKVSHVFEYNWAVRGHPEDVQRLDFDSFDNVMPKDPNFPIQRPYPAPSRDRPPPSLSSWMKSLPESRRLEETPEPGVAPSALATGENPSEPDTSNSSGGPPAPNAAFRPYEPPMQYSAIRTNLPHSEEPGKGDPYEEEEVAKRMLRSQTSPTPAPALRGVKQESGVNPAVKQEPRSEALKSTAPGQSQGSADEPPTTGVDPKLFAAWKAQRTTISQERQSITPKREPRDEMFAGKASPAASLSSAATPQPSPAPTAQSGDNCVASGVDPELFKLWQEKRAQSEQQRTVKAESTEQQLAEHEDAHPDNIPASAGNTQDKTQHPPIAYMQVQSESSSQPQPQPPQHEPRPRRTTGKPNWDVPSNPPPIRAAADPQRASSSQSRKRARSPDDPEERKRQARRKQWLDAEHKKGKPASLRHDRELDDDMILELKDRAEWNRAHNVRSEDHVEELGRRARRDPRWWDGTFF